MREVALRPSTCENRSSRVESVLPDSGTFHIRRTITCGTLSSSMVRPDSASGAIATSGCVMVGLAGMSPKYLATFFFAVSTSMSPASTSTALLGPYQVRNHCFTSSSLAALRSFIEPRSEEHTSELPSLMRISYAVFCLKKKQNTTNHKDQVLHSLQP